jgi:catechol 2,3-dioxygenase-like lactoylglutathione lyase family enzyme
MGDVEQLRLVLTVPDFEAAVALYRDALGLEQLADWSEGNGKIVLLDCGRATLELVNEQHAETIDRIEVGQRVSGPVRIAFEVVDSARTAERLVAAGGERVAEAVTTPWNDRNVRVRAPDGMQLTLFTPLE